MGEGRLRFTSKLGMKETTSLALATVRRPSSPNPGLGQTRADPKAFPKRPLPCHQARQARADVPAGPGLLRLAGRPSAGCCLCGRRLHLLWQGGQQVRDRMEGDLRPGRRLHLILHSCLVSPPLHAALPVCFTAQGRISPVCLERATAA